MCDFPSVFGMCFCREDESGFTASGYRDACFCIDESAASACVKPFLELGAYIPEQERTDFQSLDSLALNDVSAADIAPESDHLAVSIDGGKSVAIVEDR